MHPLRTAIAFITLLACLVLAGTAAMNSAQAQEPPAGYPVMHFDPETLMARFEDLARAPIAPVGQLVAQDIPPSGSLSLLHMISYVPSERDQGRCGNCWAWAATGIAGHGPPRVHLRLSSTGILAWRGGSRYNKSTPAGRASALVAVALWQMSLISTRTFPHWQCRGTIGMRDGWMATFDVQLTRVGHRT